MKLNSRQCWTGPSSSSSSNSSRRPCSFSAVRPTRRAVQAQALFGWGKKEGEKTDAEWDREEQWALQQELLRKRRSGEMISEAGLRRKRVAETVAAKKAARQAEKDALAEGRLPESLQKWQNYDKETERNANSGIVVPLLPFGIRKFDEGERFDLRSPYADDGWVDPEETDIWGSFKNIGSKLLNFGGKKPEPAERKPVIWAKDYGKYVAAQKAKAKTDTPTKK